VRACAVALLLWASASPAQWRELTWVDPSVRWRTLDTANFSVHFAEQHRPQARIVASVAEAVYPRITGMLAWQPEARIHLVLLDSTDFANGVASPLPFNYSAVFLSPPDEGELLQNRDWLELLLTHELTHIVHLDKAHGPPYSLRRIFGRVPFLFPNALQPRWIVEGLAVYAESDARNGHGRLGQSHFEGMMRAETARGLRSLREVNAEGRGFPLNREYLYGGYFFAFLRERYGSKAISELVERYSVNLVPFRVDSNAALATGKPMDALWLEYHDWLRERFAAKPGESMAQDESGGVVARAFAISSPVLAPGGLRWYIRADGYTAPKLLRQAGARAAEVVRDVELDARLAVAPDGTLLLAQPDICRNYNYLYDLYAAGAGGSWKRLTRCGRFRFAAPLADGRIAALRVEAGRAEVVMLDRQGAVERPLYRAAQEEALTGLAAKDGSVVVTSQRAGRWSLLEVAGGRVSVLLSDPAVKHSPRFGDGDEIYFVADYGKVYNVWSLRRGERSLSRWTRAPNGVREISAPSGGEMLLTTIEADGDALRLHRLPDRPLERRNVTAAQTQAPAAEPKDETRVADRRYSPWPSLRPHAWLPVVQIADGAAEFGVAVAGQDALGLHRYVLAPRYEVTQDELLGDAEYTYDGRHGVLLSRWLTVKAQGETRNLFREREISAYTINEKAQWVSTWRALSLNRRFYWGLGGALERERLHEVGAGAAPLQDERVLGLVAGVDTRRERWLSEGPSEGQQLQLFAETSSGLGGAFSGNVYRADWRGYLALGKTVLALRWNEAYGQAKAEPFQLGGSASDDIFTLPVLNEREFALRGYTSGEPALTGHRARVVTIEWRAPLADVDRHFMVPPVGLNRLSLNLFADVGAAWERGTGPDYHRGVGAELMSELRFGYLFGLHARAGVAKGIDATGKTTGYLKVGRSF
jgi:hypothetical protein